MSDDNEYKSDQQQLTTDQPHTLDYLTIFLTSAGVLSFEIVLLRVLSWSQWHHFAELAVSLALLGFGVGGTALALLGRRAGAWGDGLFAGATAFAAAGVCLAFLGNQAISVRPLFALWDRAEFTRLLILNLLAFLPFLGGAVALGQIFIRWPEQSGKLYAANMFGAGAGGILAALMLHSLELQTAFLAPGLILLTVTVLLLFLRVRILPVAIPALLCLVFFAGFLTLHKIPPLSISDFKQIAYYLDYPDARVVDSSPSMYGALTRIESDSIRIAPGLSLKWQEVVPSQDALFVETSRVIALLKTDPEQTKFLKACLAWLPWRLRPEPDALILGTSSLPALYSAQKAGARDIEWIEPHSGIVNALANSALANKIHARVGDPRGFLKNSDHPFELIILDALAVESSALDNESLATVEGLQAVLDNLTSRGLGVIPLTVNRPPRHFPRILSTLKQSFIRHGIRHGEDHLVILRTMHQALICFSPQPVDETDARKVRDFAEQWNFDRVWLPDINPKELNRYHQLNTPLFHNWVRHVFLEGEPLPEHGRLFANAAAWDNQPFFWKSMRWCSVVKLLKKWGRQGMVMLDWAPVMLAAAMLTTVLLAFLLIILPLLLRLPGKDVRAKGWFIIPYFFALGLGYLALEIILLRRVIMLAGDPVLATVIVLPAFMIGSGFGAIQLPEANFGRRLFLPLLTCLIGCWIILELASGWIWQLQSPVLRTLLPTILFSPAFYLMGRPFPLGLRALNAPSQIPWTWGVNGFASVLAAPTALLIAAETGFHVSWILGTTCYLLAWIVLCKVGPKCHR